MSELMIFSDLYGPDDPIEVTAKEEDGNTVEFTIRIDKVKLVSQALPALLAKLAAVKETEAAPKPTRRPRAAKTEPEAPTKPGMLPGQEALPFVPPAVPSVPPLPSASPTLPPPSSSAASSSSAAAVAGSGEKSLLHGVAVITTPGEGGLSATKARMEAEIAAKKKADQEAYAAKLEQIKKMKASEAAVAASAK